MKNINIPKQELIERSKLIIDDTNPNKMGDKEFEALKQVIQKYGFLIPIITNKDYKIADGYHRWKVARELDIKEVPVIALDVDEVDRRMLRQILNKLKGQHDKTLDFEEFKFLDENSVTVEIINLLPNEEKIIKSFFDQVNNPNIGGVNQQVDKLYGIEIECPKCGHKFKKKEK